MVAEWATLCGAFPPARSDEIETGN